MDGKFGCCYKLGSCTQTDNEMNIIILHLLEIGELLKIGREERENSSDGIEIWSLVFRLLTIDLFNLLFSFSRLFYLLFSLHKIQ